MDTMTEISLRGTPLNVALTRPRCAGASTSWCRSSTNKRPWKNSVRRLHRHLRDNFTFAVRITIADNASTDDTPRIAAALAVELDGVRVVRLDEKGRGRALHKVWSESDAPVLAYMDVDLSTDLAALAPLVAPLLSGHSDLAIGTRLNRGSRVVRGAKREFISRCYNLILKSTLSAGFSDAQCGFKAIRADVARELLPYVADTGWFFDTELLVLAERSGLRIHEVPVDWVDDPDSRVDIVGHRQGRPAGHRAAAARVRRRLHPGQHHCRSTRFGAGAAAPGLLLRQVVRFGTVGVLSTAAYLVLFLMLHGVVGAQLANLLALLLTAIGNTAANRRFTFGVGGRRVARHHVEGLIVFAVALAITSGSLAGLHAVDGSARPTAGDLRAGGSPTWSATVARFVLLRGWVFHPRRAR